MLTYTKFEESVVATPVESKIGTEFQTNWVQCQRRLFAKRYQEMII
jgi:hypothetical protein